MVVFHEFKVWFFVASYKIGVKKKLKKILFSKKKGGGGYICSFQSF